MKLVDKETRRAYRLTRARSTRHTDFAYWPAPTVAGLFVFLSCVRIWIRPTKQR